MKYLSAMEIICDNVGPAGRTIPCTHDIKVLITDSSQLQEYISKSSKLLQTYSNLMSKNVNKTYKLLHMILIYLIIHYKLDNIK